MIPTALIFSLMKTRVHDGKLKPLIKSIVTPLMYANNYPSSDRKTKNVSSYAEFYSFGRLSTMVLFTLNWIAIIAPRVFCRIRGTICIMPKLSGARRSRVEREVTSLCR